MAKYAVSAQASGALAMILIWGFKPLFKAIDQGHFFCPNEGGDRNYRRMQARRWFTFFWIPLIPLNVLGEYIECASCGASYEPRVLELPTTAHMEDLLSRALRHVVVAMLRADEHVDPREREAAVDVVTRFGLEGYDMAALDRDLVQLEVSDLEHELVGVAEILSPQGREGVLAACLVLAATDGHVDERELKTLIHAGRSLGMSAAHVRGVLAEVTQEAQPPS
jgi:tellurite resistance protein